jgi:hypothetical protein
MAAYADDAANAMKTYLAANLQTELTAVETEESLDEGAMTPPDAYVRGPHPRDNTSPLIQIFAEGLDADEQKSGVWNVPVVVILSWNDSGCDADAATIFMDRYLTALMRVVLKSPTLGDTVMGCYFDRADALFSEGDQSYGRHHYAIYWTVQVHSTV